MMRIYNVTVKSVNKTLFTCKYIYIESESSCLYVPPTYPSLENALSSTGNNMEVDETQSLH